MSFFSYLWGYFETNRFTLHLFLMLFFLSLFKYLRLPSLSSKKVLWLILLFGVLLRVGWIAFSSHEPHHSWNPHGTKEWDIINTHAAELTQGIWFRDADGHPMARRPIGYPMLLGLAYKIFGVHNAVAQGLHLLLFVACGWLIYELGRLAFHERAGLIAAFLFAIYPVSIYSIVLTYDEHLFLPLWYFGLFLLLKEIHGHRPRFALLLYGVIFGYAAMTRTHAIIMPWVVGFAYFLMKKSWRRVLLSIAGVFLVMQLVNLPWLIRNYKAWGVPIVYTTSGGYVYASFNSYATPEGGSHFPGPGEDGYSKELDAALKANNGPLASVLSNKQISRWIWRHPLKYIEFGGKRLFIFMGWNRAGVWPLWFQFYEGAYDPARPIPQALKDFFEETAYSFYYCLFFLFWAGIVYCVHRRKELSVESKRNLWVLASCIVLWLFEHTIIFPDRKYRFPLEPVMMLWAAYFLDVVIFKWRYSWLKRHR